MMIKYMMILMMTTSSSSSSTTTTFTTTFLLAISRTVSSFSLLQQPQQHIFTKGTRYPTISTDSSRFDSTTTTTTTTTTATTSNFQKNTIILQQQRRYASNSVSTLNTASNDSVSSSSNNNNNNNNDAIIPMITLKRNVQSRTFRDGNQLIYRKSFVATTTPPTMTSSMLQTGDIVQVGVEQQSSSSSSSSKYGGKKDTKVGRNASRNNNGSGSGNNDPSTVVPMNTLPLSVTNSVQQQPSPTTAALPSTGTTTTPIGFGIYNAYSLYTIRLLCHTTIQSALYKELLHIMKHDSLNQPVTGRNNINHDDDDDDDNDHSYQRKNKKNQMMIRCIVRYHMMAAMQLRQYLNLGNASALSLTSQTNSYTDTFRLFNGEGDGMSGIAIDIIGGNHIVVMSSAMWCEIYKDIIMDVLRDLYTTGTTELQPEQNETKKVNIVWKTAPARLIQDGMETDGSTSVSSKSVRPATGSNNRIKKGNTDRDDDDDDSDLVVDGDEDYATTTRSELDASGNNDTSGEIESHPMVISIENGIYYETYPTATGQKTGVYSDQRSNRYMMAQYCNNKRILDLCCYTGGFSLNAMIHGNATSCVGVDSSPIAIATCYANAKRNNLASDRVSFVQSDITTYLQQSIRDRVEYDIVILDPPKLAPSIKLLDKAKRKYHALNRDAISIISHTHGGLLLTCTCSAAMTQDDGGQTFLKMIQTAAQSCNKHVTLLSVHGAASCHTQSPMAYPASNYLTAALFYVHPKR